MRPFRIAIFASGGGSNFQSIADTVRSGELDVKIELLVCDRPEALVVQRAKQAEVPVFAFQPKAYESREVYEREIVQELRARKVDLIVMAGYMRLITSELVEPFYGQIINVHPSLLPAFPGINSVKQAYDYGVKITGITVHFVDGGLDSGPVIAQRSLDILTGESLEELTSRMHALEHELYPKVISWFRNERVSLDGRKVIINHT